jgi:ADP-heptose:LPS heptosyltransferase
MNLVTFAEHVAVGMEKSAGASQLIFEAGRDYVIAQSHFNRLVADEGVRQRLFKWSRIENRIPAFNATVKKPGTQRLLIYNGSGGYGDQIMTWPFAAIMKAYGFEVHVMVDPGNTSCWWNFPWIKGVHNVPMQYEEFKMFDYWIMFETVVNAEEHQDQIHPLDQMLLKVGVNPDSVDPKLKVIRPNFTFLEMQSSLAFQGKKMGMYQLSAANPVRCLPPNDSAYLLSKIAEAFPDVHWLALYDKFIPDAYKKALQCPKCEGSGRIQIAGPAVPVMIDAGTKTQQEFVAEVAKEVIAEKVAAKNEICPKCHGSGTLRHNIQLYNEPVLRHLWAMTTKASVVIGPDSMMVHVAGSMDIPCVGLWGPCNPANRTKYYKNHYPVWKKEVCQFSPCFAYAGVFPRYCPPRPNRAVCECLGAISPQDVIEQIKKVIPLPTPLPS